MITFICKVFFYSCSQVKVSVPRFYIYVGLYHSAELLPSAERLKNQKNNVLSLNIE